MNDTKFLALCILLSALMISTSIIWSTEVNQHAMESASAPVNGAPAPLAANVSSVTITGPVTLAPFAAPIPVTISTPDGNPITVKDASAKQWNR